MRPRMTATTTALMVMLLVVCSLAIGCPQCGNPAHVPGNDRVVWAEGDGYGNGEWLDQVRVAWAEPQAREISLAALGDEATATASRWTWRWSVLKTADTLTSIGIGASLRLIEFNDTAGLWLDGAPYYDDVTAHVAGFAGLSTEAAGLPLIRNLATIFQRALGANCSTVGLGALIRDDQGEIEIMGVPYATWQF